MATGTSKPRSATKSAIYRRMAEATKQPRKQVAAFFDALIALIKQEVGKKGPGIFTLPGLLKLKRVEKQATQDRMGIDPRTREPIMIKGKPKRTVVLALPLKGLKETVKDLELVHEVLARRDVEKLAANIDWEKYRRSRPPQQWFDDTDNPFEPEERSP